MMLERQPFSLPEGLRKKINDAYLMDELTCINELIDNALLTDTQTKAIKVEATQLVKTVREERKKSTGMDSFLTEYALSSEEGIALMCLAEAFLRVPDKITLDRLIKDKLACGDWKSHRGHSASFFVNATTWALMLTGNVLSPEKADSVLSKALMKLVNRSSEHVIRAAVKKAMRIMSKQFVMGRTIDEALGRARKQEACGYLYSYDMLGEAALTVEDAKRYFEAYSQAIETIGNKMAGGKTVKQRPGISIKLSALHPKYHEAYHVKVMEELPSQLLLLCQKAKKFDIALTVDAEESERLDLSLDIMEKVFCDERLEGWNGFGLALQSYQKRAFYVLDWVAALARSKDRRIMVRLIKGAYWDSEIKKAQMLGLTEYPVFTHKVFTDVSFQACTKKILTMTDAIYPQFATHNAYTVATVMSLAGDYKDYEFQSLHGMGAELYEHIIPNDKYAIGCRIYAPVGSHEDLLPYLVRRLLENGANSSFVNRIVDEKAPIEELVFDPIQKARQLLPHINKNIPLPQNIFMPTRKNSKGIDLTDRAVRANLQQKLASYKPGDWEATAIIAGSKRSVPNVNVFSPQQANQVVGLIRESNREDIELALTQAKTAFNDWSKKPVEYRASCLEEAADLLENNLPQMLALLCLEAGKTWSDSIAEVREAVDFCRYYAKTAREILTNPVQFSGYTGETNELSLHPRGTIVCISPWNFPLAIFTGQIAAALVTGNCVIAKPAEQTPLIAALLVNFLLKAGVPKGVVQLLLGTGEAVGAPLVADQRVKGVIFTGSTDTANRINTTLATRGGPIVPLIAETGGQNAMIVDSSALLEQVVMDVILSAFGSAGQRCSALRVLYVQDEIYPRFIRLLKGAMAELTIGDPCWLDTDVGPVIDADALEKLKKHTTKMAEKYELIYQCDLDNDAANGYFMPPSAIAIDHISALEQEVFGPVLHVIRYHQKNLENIINDINSTQFGLTLGIHSRINETAEYIRNRVHVGNCYVNRNMTGAVVGLQPFGGEGLSGTGPKAGGPQYLYRLCQERTYTVDTTAAGGNASLMSLTD